MKKASRRPRKSSKCQEHLLKLFQLRDRGTTSAEHTQEWQQMWEHLHAQWGEDFWRMAWCQEGQQRSHFSLGKTSGTDWYSAKGTGIALLKTEVVSVVWGIRKKLVRRRKGEHYHVSCQQSWDHSCVGLLLSQGSIGSLTILPKNTAMNKEWYKNIFWEQFLPTIQQFGDKKMPFPA